MAPQSCVYIRHVKDAGCCQQQCIHPGSCLNSHIPAEVVPTDSDCARRTLIQTDGACVCVPLLHYFCPLVSLCSTIGQSSCALAFHICSDLLLPVVHVLHCAPLAAQGFMTGSCRRSCCSSCLAFTGFEVVIGFQDELGSSAGTHVKSECA